MKRTPCPLDEPRAPAKRRNRNAEPLIRTHQIQAHTCTASARHRQHCRAQWLLERHPRT
jgi:hypothetical protein